MTPEHPAESEITGITASVTRVYPATWELDCQAIFAAHGLVIRARVKSHFLPEVDVEQKRSIVVVAWTDGYQQAPIAIPVHNLIIPDDEKASHIFWSQHLNFLFRINRTGEIEIRNLKGDQLLQFRIQEDGGVVRVDTPSTMVVLKEADRTITLKTTKHVQVTCATAEVDASESVDIKTPRFTVNG